MSRTARTFGVPSLDLAPDPRRFPFMLSEPRVPPLAAAVRGARAENFGACSAERPFHHARSPRERQGSSRDAR